MDELEPRIDTTDEGPASAETGEGAPTAPRKRRMRWIVGGLVAALAIGATVAAVMVLGAKPVPEALRYLPSDSVFVIELRPELPGDQRQNLGNLLAHFPGFADQSTLSAKLDETLDRIVSQGSNGSVDYATRVKPLLAGPLVAGAGTASLSGMASGGSGASGLLVATTDGSATCDLVFGSSTALETHRSIELRSVENDLVCAVDGHFMLMGDAASIRAGIDAHAGAKGVDTNAHFAAARKSLAADHLGLLYVDVKGMVALADQLTPEAGIAATLGSSAADWVIVGMRVLDDAVLFEAQAAPISPPDLPSGAPTAAPAAKSRFAPLLPADTYGFIEIHGTGALLQRTLATLKTDPSQADAMAQLEEGLAALGGIDNLAAWIEEVGIAAMPSGDGAKSISNFAFRRFGRGRNCTNTTSAAPSGLAVKYHTLDPAAPVVRSYSFIARDPRNRESLHVECALGTILIDHVVDGTVVAFLPDTNVQDPFADEFLVGHLGDHHGAVHPEHDDVINVRTLTDEFEIPKTGPCESFLPIHVQLAVGHRDLGGHDGVEGADLSLALAPCRTSSSIP